MCRGPACLDKYTFNQINQAIEDQKQGKVVKIVFTCS